MTRFLANWSPVFNVMKAWYVDCFSVENPQLKEKKKKKFDNSFRVTYAHVLSLPQPPNGRMRYAH